jgi:hypothetical protein
MSKLTFFVLLISALAIGFAAGHFVAEPLRGGLLVALQPLLSNPAALIASSVALLVGLLAFIANWRQSTVAKRSADAANTSAQAAKTSADAAMMNANYAGTRTLAQVRIAWLESVRDTLSEYHSILMTPKEEDPDADEAAKVKAKEKDEADRRQLSYLGTKLDLLLNQKKKLQKALWQVSDDILKMTDARSLTEEELDEADKQLVAAARNVLDFHWQKIKAEILGMPKVTEPSDEPPTQTKDA